MNTTRLTACLLAGALLASSAAQAAGKVRFNRDIRPILSENCYYCHGPDPKHREADLRLDDRAAAIEAKAILPGNPTDSELIARIITDDEDDLMPPPDTHKVLKPAQKELIKQWIAEGANYEAHWAYTPLVKPAVPKADKTTAAIDAFIRATLAEKNLQPSEQADPRTLIRRVSLDLTGLPPSVAEVNAFVKAWETEREGAYEALVDRLLRSPHYGERHGRVVAGCGAVCGHGGLPRRSESAHLPVSRLRDRRVQRRTSASTNSLWSNWPATCCPSRHPQQLTATGYNRLNMMTREGGAQPKEYLAKYGAERVRTVAACVVWGPPSPAPSATTTSIDPIKTSATSTRSRRSSPM
jgi:hypothetical protein